MLRAILNFSLEANLHSTTKTSWSVSSKVVDDRTGRVLQRSGQRVERGWRWAWQNGRAHFGPYQHTFALTVDGDERVTGKAARALQRSLKASSPEYRADAPGLIHRLFIALLALPCHLLALLVTVITMPIFVAVWMIVFFTFVTVVIVAWIILTLSTLVLRTGSLLGRIWRLCTPAR